MKEIRRSDAKLQPLRMSYDVTIAVLADWLPKFDPPFGDNGFGKPYRDRLKLQLTVDGTETLTSVYQRAIEHWQPQVSADSSAHPENLMQVMYWAWFYLPEDELGFHDRYESPTELILINEEGRAQWNLRADEIPYGHLVRAGEQGLLRGDPLRPYLPMLLPQGGGGFQAGWETLLTTWKILEELLVARGVYSLGSEAQHRLLGRLRRRRVVEAHSDEWIARGGAARNVSRTIDRKAWSPDDLRIVMNVPTSQDAEDLLALFGHEPSATGDYVISESDEARILRLAEDDVFNTFISGATDAELRPRLERLLATGELPD
jgi:hypothetical protein